MARRDFSFERVTDVPDVVPTLTDQALNDDQYDRLGATMFFNGSEALSPVEGYAGRFRGPDTTPMGMAALAGNVEAAYAERHAQRSQKDRNLLLNMAIRNRITMAIEEIDNLNELRQFLTPWPPSDHNNLVAALTPDLMIEPIELRLKEVAHLTNCLSPRRKLKRLRYVTSDALAGDNLTDTMIGRAVRDLRPATSGLLKVSEKSEPLTPLWIMERADKWAFLRDFEAGHR